MFSSRVAKKTASAAASSARRSFATVQPVSPAGRSHKVVVVGGGSAGLAISHQLLRAAEGKFTQDDIAIVDPAEWHHYQPGWTLVGGGLKHKQELRERMDSLVDPKLKLYKTNVPVGGFAPEQNTITLGSGEKLQYEQLVVAPGISINYDAIKGLPEALADPHAPVSTIYGYETCDKVFRNIDQMKKGTAIFTQPAGVIKCAGAPQKAMWLATDHWRSKGLYDYSGRNSAINVKFATGLPSMFAVPKYAAALEQIRKDRSVEGLFQHDLTSIEGNTANFTRTNGDSGTVSVKFDLLHAVPKLGPHRFVKESALANEAGFVDVDDGTTQHKKYPNVWSAGDASSLPTSKTAAAVTAEAPVLVQNMLRAMEKKEPNAVYDGYTSCPLTVAYGKVLLAEFKYGGVPKETFGEWLGIDQAEPRRSFYHLKKDFFPWVYFNNMVKGTWGGPKGWLN